MIKTRLQKSELAKITAELERKDFRSFIVGAWPFVDPSPYVPGWHIDAMADHLEAACRREIRSLLINVPPRHTKTLIASVLWPAWIWVNDPSFRTLGAAYEATLAKEASIRARDLMHSPWYRNLNCKPDGSPIFRLAGDGPDMKKTPDQQGWYENDRQGARKTVGVGGSATGKGGDLVLIDDPHNPEQALSDLDRARALRWYDRTMSTRLNNPKTGLRVLIMQRLHELDLSAHVMAQAMSASAEDGDEVVHLCLPAEFDRKRICTTMLGFRDPRTEDGELLCPERFDRKAINALKIVLGPIAAAGQLQQNPVPEGGGLYKRHWVKHWSILPRRFDAILDSWDCSFKDEDDSSFVVGQRWGFVGGDAYLLTQIRDQMDLPTTIQAVLNLAALKPKSSAKLIEDKANGPGVISSVKRLVPGILPVEPEGGKYARASAVSPFWASGNVYLPPVEEAPWVLALIDEICTFPRAIHDDQVDSMSQALTHHFLGEKGDREERKRKLRASLGLKRPEA